MSRSGWPFHPLEMLRDGNVVASTAGDIVREDESVGQGMIAQSCPGADIDEKTRSECEK